MEQSLNGKQHSAVKKNGKSIISSEVKDYSNDPFVLKKARESKEFLEKHGFPEELLRLRQAKYSK